ncbi:hypothetical protein K505DRAFT_261466, partial [Melanomma pulvis-pyrius CBS 109.77]
RSKHIGIYYYFVRERYLEGEYKVHYVPLAENLGDICTKALPRPTLQRLVSLIS